METGVTSLVDKLKDFSLQVVEFALCIGFLPLLENGVNFVDLYMKQECLHSLCCLDFLGSYYIAPPLIAMTHTWLVVRTVVTAGVSWIAFQHQWKHALHWLLFSLLSLLFWALHTVSLLPPWPSKGSGRDTTTSSQRENLHRFNSLTKSFTINDLPFLQVARCS